MPSQRTSAVESMTRTVLWALRQPIPARHSRLLAVMATYTSARRATIWPSCSTLAEAGGPRLGGAMGVEMLILELETTGLISRTGSHIELMRDEDISSTNPLLGILFREQMQLVAGPTPYERWVCEYLGRAFDWEVLLAPASYPDAAERMAVIAEKSRWTFQRALVSLTDRGLIELVRRAPNHHEKSLYRLILPESSGSTAAPLDPSSGSTAAPLNHHTSILEQEEQGEPRARARETPPVSLPAPVSFAESDPDDESDPEWGPVHRLNRIISEANEQYKGVDRHVLHEFERPIERPIELP